MNRVSTRLVRSSVRYLRERLGPVAIEELRKGLPTGAALGGPLRDSDWLDVGVWVATLERLEARFGDVATWRLTREMTRVTMAVALSKAWSAFLAGATRDSLLDRAATFWSMSFDTGRLEVAERGPNHVRLVVTGWPSPPAAVGAQVGEACNVFLARLGEKSPRVVDSVVGGQLTVDITWS